ncbi:MAG TPA: hypothetical protein VJ974_05920 [Geopsychrobacteraceae bacterium]|nr:hypothetical protein [Geopsychrobacteraceae bacterium]
MADELLSSIIRLENEIQEQLKAEQQRADQWLSRVRTEELERFHSISRQLEEADENALQEARLRATDEANEIEHRETEHCRRLEILEDKELVEILKRHVTRVLPGRIDDHQDVQS